MTLENRTALVTGSSRNIGRAIATELAAQGASAGVTAVSDETGCQGTVEQIRNDGGTAAYALGDLSDPDAVRAVTEEIREVLGPIDILVNNASIRPLTPFLDVDVEEWDRVHRVDLRAMFLLTQQVLPDMIERGKGNIVNIAGITISLGMPGKTHVVANKAGIVGLTRGTALEFGADGVRSNMIVLGVIDTDRDSAKYQSWEDVRDRARDVSALGRVGYPDEVAEVCEYLVSDRSSYITGQVLHVNGGMFPISHMFESP